MRKPETLKEHLTVVIALLSIAGTAYAGFTVVENHYQTKAEAQRYAEDSERARLELQVELYRLKLDNLRTRDTPTAEDQDDMKYLEKVIAEIRARLAGLEN